MIFIFLSISLSFEFFIFKIILSFLSIINFIIFSNDYHFFKVF